MKKVILIAFAVSLAATCSSQTKRDFNRNKYPVEIVVADTVFKPPQEEISKRFKECQCFANYDSESKQSVFNKKPVLTTKAYVILDGEWIFEHGIAVSEVKKRILAHYKDPNSYYISFGMMEFTSDYRVTLNKVYIILTPTCQDGVCSWKSEYYLPTWLFPEVFEYCRVCNK